MDNNAIQVLANVHDAVLGQVRKGDYDTLRHAVSLMSVPVQIGKRVMNIATECTIGLNWGKASEANPHGQRVLPHAA